MQLKQLEYFVAVAEHLNFRKAAESLYVTQPLLSKQIAELEHEIGYPLFVRNTRSVKLTPAGETLLREAGSIIHQSAMVLRTVRQAAQGTEVSGVLNIGYEDSFDRVMLAGALNRLREKYPNISFNIHHYSFNQMSQVLQENAIDMGCILLPDKKLAANLNCEVLSTERMCLAAARRCIAEDRLEEYVELAQSVPMYMLDKNSKGISVVSRICADMDIAPDFHFVENVRAMLLYAEAGAGVAVVPWSVYEAYKSPYLVARELPSESAVICMACAWNRQNSNKLRGMLLEELRGGDAQCASCANAWCRMHE